MITFAITSVFTQNLLVRTLGCSATAATISAPTTRRRGDLCRTSRPELLPGSRGDGHLKACHLANPDEVFQNEILVEIAPELAQES